MRLFSFRDDRGHGVGVRTKTGYRGIPVSEFGSDLFGIIQCDDQAFDRASQQLKRAPSIDADTFKFLPPLPHPGKIICIGLNYADHAAESNFETPKYPAVFSRFSSSLIAHRESIIRPCVSNQLDYEGELVAVIGRRGRYIAEENALEYVFGYSVFNDASIRDYQFKSSQWLIGKTFDGTGAFGPEIVTADELPLGCRGLRIETRLNGRTVQSASIDELIFGIASLVSILSEVMTLNPGDIIVSGTPAGVGLSRKPPLWMTPGDVCEIEIEGIGILSNSISQGDGQVTRAA